MNDSSADSSDSEPVTKRIKMNNKTPISILTELCSQKKVNKPIFEELDVDPGHTFKFYIKCTAMGKSASAKGVTKKGAKHSAAECLLAKINNNYDSDDDDDDDSSFVSSTDYVSELLNLCVQKNFHKPEFVIIESYGPTHCPTFTYECRLDSIKRTGSASNKQLAKKLAAKEVLDILKLSYPDQEKKVKIVNEVNMAKEEARRKITSYMELKNCNKTGKMGTLLTNRHNFFLDYKNEEFIESLKHVLESDMDLEQKYFLLLERLTSEWEYNISDFGDGQKMFELLIDFDQFTVNLIAKEKDMKKTVIDYFMNMLELTPVKDHHRERILSDDDLVLLTFN